ncbi:hypothetical protein [Sinimarinibacterium thermocellulolyticum]|uniref:Peptidase family M50 n=1 Tax=Sinimarinibacterium thermocellulolyticum TaxID=3170016 RepID=A0ABV2ACV3_9GAMM
MKLPLKLLLRDLLIIAAAIVVREASHGLEASGSAAHWPLALVAGALLALAGYLVHEWGHLLGALASRSRVELPDTVAAVFLFKFDVGANDRRQFLWMSAGGFAASAIVVALSLALLSFDRLADGIALVLTGLGVLATAVLELPPAWRVLRGAGLPQQGPAFVGTKPSD